MADISAQLLAQVKDFADVQSVTTFDSDISTYYIPQAIKLLYPLAQREIDVQTATLGSDKRTLTLPANVLRASSVEIDTGTGAQRIDSSDYKHFGTKLVFNCEQTYALTIYVYGLGRYDVTNLEPELEMVVAYWATAMFYQALAGNKRKYNAYIGSQGAAQDHDVKDSAEYFMNLGNQVLADRATLRGA